MLTRDQIACIVETCEWARRQLGTGVEPQEPPSLSIVDVAAFAARDWLLEVDTSVDLDRLLDSDEDAVLVEELCALALMFEDHDQELLRVARAVWRRILKRRAARRGSGRCAGGGDS